MQQYFTNQKCEIGKEVPLDEESLFHLKKVLRKTDGWKFRIADKDGVIYFAELRNNNACILEDTKEDNELDTDITVLISLVKSDKFELSLQKLTELGVKKIVPFKAKRSVIEISKSSKYDRFRKIVKEASEQSHRNKIPEICEAISLKEVKQYLSENNYIAYEKEERRIVDLKVDDSVTIVIGPEGGFEVEEVKEFQNLGFESVSLGKRILRAETAAIFFTSLIVSKKI